MVAAFLRSTGFLAAAFVLLWNSGFIAAEVALAATGPLTLLFWRYWGLTLFLGLYLAARGRLRWPGAGAAGTAAGIGILAHGVWLGCVFLSLQQGVPAGFVALVVALQPLVTGALSGVVTGERTPAGRWLGLVVGFAGVAIAVVGRANLGYGPSVAAHLIPFGSVVAITAASLWQRRLDLRGHTLRLPLDLALFYQGLGTAVAVTLPAVAMDGLATAWTTPFILANLWLILGVSLAAYGLMWMLIAREDATRVASLFYLGPPVTLVMAWIAFGDRLQGADLLGLGVVAGGVWLTHRGDRRP